jgi:peroxiredoxin
MAVQVGQAAPSFSLVDTDRKVRSLDEFKGSKTVLVFYPGAFTGVCTKELCTFRDSMSRFNELSAKVVGISVDAPFANKAFATQHQLEFPLLSDYNREAVKAYGIALDNFAGLSGYTASQRAVFALDKNGVIRYVEVTANPGVEPNYDALVAALGTF